MPKARHTNPSTKARQARVYRKNQKQQKRFEAPLREFIEVKYKNIFHEYVELYNRMDTQNPTKIDLKKSELFKRWKEEEEEKQKEANTVDPLTKAIKETIEGSENNSVDSEDEASGAEHHAVDPLSKAIKETIEGSENNSVDSEDEASGAEHQEGEGNQIWGQDEGILAVQRVDALVNEMIIDDELRALLNTEPENDEGIGLNVEDELSIEDFDYQLEVEDI